MSVNFSPVQRIKEDGAAKQVESGEEVVTIGGLKKKNDDLKRQLADALSKLRLLEDRMECYEKAEGEANALKTRIEQLEAELAVSKVELRIRQDDVDEENDKLAKQLDSLKVCTIISLLRF